MNLTAVCATSLFVRTPDFHIDNMFVACNLDSRVSGTGLISILTHSRQDYEKWAATICHSVFPAFLVEAKKGSETMVSNVRCTFKSVLHVHFSRREL
jgi:hypothetical protein